MKDWKYTNTENCEAGNMICCSCNKKIIEGEFRWYENTKKDAYISQHRACAENDSGWKKLDQQRKKEADLKAEFEKDCRIFSEKWNISYEELIAM